MSEGLRIETEKEFKYELNKRDFLNIDRYLCEAGYKKADAIEQINYYIDTVNFELRKKGTTLRVRHYLKNDRFELTAKIKKNSFNGREELKVKEELNVDISEIQANDIIEKGMIIEYLYLFQNKAPMINDKRIVNKLMVLGNLETRRQNYFINESTFISLDESKYFNKVDYELELETNNEFEDKAFLFEMFKELKISLSKDNNSKFKRFICELKKHK